MTFRSPDQIASDGMADIGVQHIPPKRSENAVQAPAYAASGVALANQAITEARHQGSAWGRMYVSMLALEAEGRKAFRVTIAQHQKQMQTHVNATKTDGGEVNPVYEGAKRSAMVRLSELTTISKALDTGVEFDNTWPFHTAVAHARVALRSQSAGSKRGRKATPWMDKVKAYLLANVPAGEFEQCVELVETLAKTQE